jgi:hypothetical protein
MFELRAAIVLAEQRPDEGITLLRAALSALPDPQPWPDVVHANTLSGVPCPLAASGSHL